MEANRNVADGDWAIRNAVMRLRAAHSTVTAFAASILRE